MGTTPTENDEPRIRTQAAKVAAAVEYAARSPLGETEPLGLFEGLTSKGFRLVWEDGVLLLVAYSEHPLDSTLVADIERRLRWVENNRDLVQERLRAVIGPDTIMANCAVRVVVHGTNDSEEVELAKLASHVELCSLPDPRRMLTKPETPHAVSAPGPATLDATSLSDSYLLELRRAASDAKHREGWVDRTDWRCSPTLNLVRVYGLLVTIAASFTVPSSLKKPAVTSRLGAATNLHGKAISAKVYGVLGRFVDAIARERFHAKELATVLAEVTALVDEQLQDRASGRQGAYLGPAWKSPVPPQIGSLISCMAGSSTQTERAEAFATAKGAIAKLLEETNFGVASSVHIAQTLDDRRWPEAPVDSDQRYLQGALLRVLAGHRLLLELVGVKSQPARLALLGLAEKIALQTTFAAFWTAITDPDKQSRDYLNTVQRGALEILRGAGRVSGVGRDASALRDITKFQEEAVLSAMKAALRIGCG
jgi:hypothetical protein